eukprot:gene10594-22114_t
MPWCRVHLHPLAPALTPFHSPPPCNTSTSSCWKANQIPLASCNPTSTHADVKPVYQAALSKTQHRTTLANHKSSSSRYSLASLHKPVSHHTQGPNFRPPSTASPTAIYYPKQLVPSNLLLTAQTGSLPETHYPPCTTISTDNAKVHQG